MPSTSAPGQPIAAPFTSTNGGAPKPAYDRLVEADRVHRAIYTDPAIFAQEMRNVFGALWVYVAHESELSEPNSFKTATLGGRPIIVTRAPDGHVHTLMNRCLHRGATVCRVQRGRAKRFVCPYHGWSYDNTGKLTGVPWPSGYSEDWDRSGLGLGRARTASYRGFIFATLNPEPEPIADYLAGARPLLDYWIDRFPGRVIARSRAHRMDCHANWKLVMDNSTDGYHPAFSHRSLLQVAQRLGESKDMKYFAESPDEGPMYCQYLGNGHGFIDQRPMYSSGAGAYWAQQRPQPGREAFEAFVRERYAPEVATRLLDLTVGAQMNLTIFPNLMIIGNQIQTLEPIAIDRTQLVWHATTAEGLPDELNTLRMRTQEDFPSFGEPDDLANFAECQRGLSIGEIEWVYMNRGYGVEGRQSTEDGVITAPATDETPMRGYLNHWRRVMSDDVRLSVDGVPG